MAQTSWSVQVDDIGWGFGQILPVFLLIGPILAAIEAIAPESEPDESSNVSNRHEPAEAAGDHVLPSNCITSPHPSTPQPTETPTTQPEAQVLLSQHLVVNNTPPTPQKLTPPQLRAQLHAYYTDKHVMAATLVLACLQVLLVTAMLFPIITVSSFKVASILATAAINLLLVQLINCFMVTLWGVVWHVEDGPTPTAMLGAHSGGSQSRRQHRLCRRWCGALLQGALVLGLAGIGTVLLLLGHGTFELERGGSALLVLYLGGSLFFVCGMAIWDILLRPWATARRERHRRTDALLLVDRTEGNLSV